MTIGVVPGAMPTAFFGPDVNHLTSEVERVSYDRRDTKREAHVEGFDVVVAEVVIGPHEEELILEEGVEGAISCPKHQLTAPNGETTLEQVGESLFERYPEHGIYR